MSSLPGPAGSNPYLPPQSDAKPEPKPACRAFSSAAVESVIASRRPMLIGGACMTFGAVLEIISYCARLTALTKARYDSGMESFPVVSVGMGAVAITVMLVPWWCLKRSTDAIKRLQLSRHDQDLEAALREHGRYWARLGIGLLAGVVIAFLLPLVILPFLNRS